MFTKYGLYSIAAIVILAVTARFALAFNAGIDTALGSRFVSGMICFGLVAIGFAGLASIKDARFRELQFWIGGSASGAIIGLSLMLAFIERVGLRNALATVGILAFIAIFVHRGRDDPKAARIAELGTRPPVDISV